MGNISLRYASPWLSSAVCLATCKYRNENKVVNIGTSESEVRYRGLKFI